MKSFKVRHSKAGNKDVTLVLAPNKRVYSIFGKLERKKAIMTAIIQQKNGIFSSPLGRRKFKNL